jgi:hypothetical protein
METKSDNEPIYMALQEGKRQGVIIAIDALRNKEFRKMFELDDLESEICAEALFIHRDKLLNG